MLDSGLLCFLQNLKKFQKIDFTHSCKAHCVVNLDATLRKTGIARRESFFGFSVFAELFGQPFVGALFVSQDNFYTIKLFAFREDTENPPNMVEFGHVFTKGQQYSEPNSTISLIYDYPISTSIPVTG